MNYPLLNKCSKYAKEHRLEGMAAIEKKLAKEPNFTEFRFVPCTEGEATAGKPIYAYNEGERLLDAAIPVSDGKSPVAILRCKVIAEKEYIANNTKQCLEAICTALNPNGPKGIVIEGTPWGKIEIRHSEQNHRNYYRPDGAVLYTDAAIEYLSREDAERFMEKEMKCLPPCGWVDERFTLDYPLFKMRIRRYEDKTLSYSCNADGIWQVLVPNEYDFSRENVSWVLYKHFHKVLLIAAECYFRERVAYFQSKMMTPKKIRKVIVSFIKCNAVGQNIKNPDETWSSPGKAERDLHFDANLMAYPEKFTDSVIIHELCHNIIWEHSEKFYDLEVHWCLSLLKIGPHYYDDFLQSHRLILFAPNPWKAIK